MNYQNTEWDALPREPWGELYIRERIGLWDHPHAPSSISYEAYRWLIDAFLSIEDWERCPLSDLISACVDHTWWALDDASGGDALMQKEFASSSVYALWCYLREYRAKISELRTELDANTRDLYELSRLASRKSDINFFRYLEVWEEWIVYNFLSQNKNDIEIARWMDSLDISKDERDFLLHILTTYNKHSFKSITEFSDVIRSAYPSWADAILIDLARIIYERDEVNPVEIRLSEWAPAIVLIYDDPYAHRGEWVGGYFPYHESPREPYIQIYDSGDGVSDAIDHEIMHFFYHYLIRSVLKRWGLMTSEEQEVWVHIQDGVIAYAEDIIADDISEDDLLPRHLDISQDTMRIAEQILKNIRLIRLAPEDTSKIALSSKSLSEYARRIERIIIG